jgi:hypothetical protein
MALLTVAAEQKKEWIEPQIRALDVRETAIGAPNRGGDLSVNGYIDCSLS